MTNRHGGYIVVLDHDIREDDAEAVIAALKMIKGVLSVEPVVGDVRLMLAEARANTDWVNRILDMLDRAKKEPSTR